MAGVWTRTAVLVEDLIGYLIRHGVADLSLRPMAAAAGTSARLLIFHFGSKERLLIEALDEMQARLQRSLADLLAGGNGGPPPPPPRLFFGVGARARHPPPPPRPFSVRNSRARGHRTHRE